MYHDSFFESFGLVIGIIVWFGIIYFIWKLVVRRNKNTVFLALSQFDVNPDADNQVVIEGRKTGFMQWLLVQLKLGNLYKLHVRKDFISFSSESIKGEELTLTPVQKIASTSCGFKRPIGWQIWAVVMFLLSLIAFGMSAVEIGFLFILVGGLFLVLYHYNKSFYVSIQTIGGSWFILEFRRALFENIPIDLPYVKKAIEQINDLVLKSQ